MEGPSYAYLMEVVLNVDIAKQREDISDLEDRLWEGVIYISMYWIAFYCYFTVHCLMVQTLL
jgi:hypothetical protein